MFWQDRSATMADESLLNDSNLGALGSNDDDSELIIEVRILGFFLVV